MCWSAGFFCVCVCVRRWVLCIPFHFTFYKANKSFFNCTERDHKHVKKSLINPLHAWNMLFFSGMVKHGRKKDNLQVFGIFFFLFTGS